MQKYLIRFFDFLFSLSGIFILLPFLVVISLLIILDSKGGILFKQRRVGKDNVDFWLLKFRTMKSDSEKSGLLSVGKKDIRITSIGHWLRRFKLDELPQLINVLRGEMSLVGPRPEVRKYVDLYSPEQRKVLSVKPGITDLASIQYINESELLGNSENPEKTYIEQVMPAKISLNMKFIGQPGIRNYFSIIIQTIGRIISLY